MLILMTVNLFILALVIWNALTWPKPSMAKEFQFETCSILIPARNEEAKLGDCIKSALSQGSEVIEIIVCNDHSEDNTTAVVRQYQKIDTRLKLIEAKDLP
ncbi:MAG: glycosyltransferase family 2 protein, partial [Thermodesulfobacteriota bacterium]|nr:glycosyltransferase family 2 protein [Thermodesulfobacteriota bacterium]